MRLKLLHKILIIVGLAVLIYIIYLLCKSSNIKNKYNKLVFLTYVDNDKHPNVIELKQNLGKNFYVIKEKWNGFMYRLIKYKDFVKNIDPNTIVCIIDGYDVHYNKRKKITDLINTFLSFKKKIVISVERGNRKACHNNIFPLFSSKLDSDGNADKPIFPNAGCIIGIASELYKFYNNIINHKPNRDGCSSKDDQDILTSYLNNYTNNIELDYKQKIFHTCAFNNPENYYLKNGNLYCTKDFPYNILSPFFVHGAGDSDNRVCKNLI